MSFHRPAEPQLVTAQSSELLQLFGSPLDQPAYRPEYHEPSPQPDAELVGVDDEPE